MLTDFFDAFSRRDRADSDTEVPTSVLLRPAFQSVDPRQASARDQRAAGLMCALEPISPVTKGESHDGLQGASLRKQSLQG